MGHLNIIAKIREGLSALSEEEKIPVINELRAVISEYSPFKCHPVDCVLWEKSENIHSNDYNPNIVAAPEMKLLKKSIEADGYTMPIVTWKEDNGKYEIIDGFHRSKVGMSRSFKARLNGYLPISVVNSDPEKRGERIASTVRHNRARGKHTVDGMQELVLDLSRRNWSENKICKELGMDADEVLRLKQISGLAEMFTDKEFSKAWEI